ncbi:MAG: hypothetical protein ABW185_04070 [Sedimenticola sp.]
MTKFERNAHDGSRTVYYSSNIHYNVSISVTNCSVGTSSQAVLLDEHARRQVDTPKLSDFVIHFISGSSNQHEYRRHTRDEYQHDADPFYDRQVTLHVRRRILELFDHQHTTGPRFRVHGTNDNISLESVSYIPPFFLSAQKAPGGGGSKRDTDTIRSRRRPILFPRIGSECLFLFVGRGRNRCPSSMTYVADITSSSNVTRFLDIVCTFLYISLRIWRLSSSVVIPTTGRRVNTKR